MNAIDLLIQDHRTVEDLFAQFESAKAAAKKQETVKQFTRELSIHAAIEEQMLYPLVRMRLDNGNELAREAIDEHAEVKQVLARLEKMDPSHEEYDTKVTQ